MIYLILILILCLISPDLYNTIKFRHFDCAKYILDNTKIENNITSISFRNCPNRYVCIKVMEFYLKSLI